MAGIVDDIEVLANIFSPPPRQRAILAQLSQARFTNDQAKALANNWTRFALRLFHTESNGKCLIAILHKLVFDHNLADGLLDAAQLTLLLNFVVLEDDSEVRHRGFELLSHTVPHIHERPAFGRNRAL